jgi:lauroyl/myristoyl acyltransferase
LFRLLAHWRWLYRQVCESAVNQALARGVVDDPARWHWMRRLVTLVDHADYYLSRTRSCKRAARWLARYVTEEGTWTPPDRAAILCSFHWGAGMWGLRSAACAGLRPHALVARLEQAAFQGRAVLGWYTRARLREPARILRQETLDISQSLRPVVRALRADGQIIGVVDVPADQAAASEPVTVLGLDARVPRGLLRLAVDQCAPVVVYLTGFDARTGRRWIRIEQLGVYDDVSVLIGEVFRRLDTALQQNPAAWHFWSESARFFSRVACHSDDLRPKS